MFCEAVSLGAGEWTAWGFFLWRSRPLYRARRGDSPPSARKYWTRRGIAEWLVERLAEDAPTLVGIDHVFFFPIRYFKTHGPKPDWANFLDDFQRHWPTDRDIYVDFVRDGLVGNGAERMARL